MNIAYWLNSTRWFWKEPFHLYCLRYVLFSFFTFTVGLEFDVNNLLCIFRLFILFVPNCIVFWAVQCICDSAGFERLHKSWEIPFQARLIQVNNRSLLGALFFPERVYVNSPFTIHISYSIPLPRKQWHIRDLDCATSGKFESQLVKQA